MPRECDCPAWVTRCAHMDERVLWLVLSGQPECSCLSPNHTTSTVLFAARLIRCPRDNTLTHIARDNRDRVYAGHSEADALAAFVDAERELLGRERSA